MFTDYVGGTDLRFVASDVDSRRFGFAVGRCVVPRDAGVSRGELTRALSTSDYEVVILRVAAERFDLELALRDDPRLEVLRADTLRYWRRDAATGPAGDTGAHDLGSSRGDAHSVREATVDDQGGIERVARRAFAGYPTHYRANPRFADALVADGFCEWATSGLGRPEATTLVAGGINDVAGFLLAKPAGEDLEVLLNAVDPTAEGRGFYTSMLSAVIHRAVSESRRRVWISTQADNERVMRVWTRLGFVPGFDLMTLHVMRRT
jgi:ribosomal protein S18 acetylase RimI-like enzyme